MYKNYKNDPFIKLILSLSIIVIIVILTLNTGLYIYFSNLLKEFYINNINFNQIQLLDNVENIKNQIPVTTLQILSDKDIISSMNSNSSSNSIIAENTIHKYLTYNYIDKLIIYDIAKQTIFVDKNMTATTINTYNKTNPSFTTLLEHYEKDGVGFVSTLDENGNSNLVYIHKDYRNILLFYYISDSNYLKIFKKQYTPFKSNTCIFYDNYPIVFSEKNNTDIFNDTYILNKINSGEHTFVYENHLVVYNEQSRSSCISIIEYSDIVLQTQKNTYSILLLTFVLLCVILVVLRFFSSKFKNIVDNFKTRIFSSENELQNANTIIAISKLFLDSKMSTEEFHAISTIFCQDNLCMLKSIVMRIDNIDNLLFADRFRSDIDSYKDIIIKKTEEILCVSGICKAVNLNNECFGIVVSSNKADIDNELERYLSEINYAIENILSASLTFAISNNIYDINELIEKSPHILDLSNYCFFTGYKSIIFEKTINIPVENLEFCFDIQDKILNSIASNNIEEFGEFIDNFVLYICSGDYAFAKESFIVLATNMIKHSKLYNIPINTDIIHLLLQSDTLEKSINVLKTSISMKFTSIDDENNAFISQVESFVAEGYYNPDFSICDLAQLINVTPSYAGKKFKNSFGKSFNVYLTEYRLEKAKELLKNFDKKVSEISLMCGFRSDTYFVTMFKKILKMTPQEYKKSLINQHS